MIEIKELLNKDLNNQKKSNHSKLEIENNKEGKLTGLNCDLCKNKGHTFVENDDGELDLKVCVCMTRRKNILEIERKDMQRLFEECTFDNYREKFDWQIKAKQKAKDFVKAQDGSIVFLGAIGSGKTHLAISVLNELMDTPFIIYKWADLMQELKSKIFDDEYLTIINRVKGVELLLLDDLFKLGRDNTPSNSDLTHTQKIIDYRYMTGRKTIITSEVMLDELLEISESIGSRIKQSAKNNVIQIKREQGRNYRL